MVDLWLTAIENLLLDAPGNADPQLGPIWSATLARLGETDRTIARAARCYWDYFEANDVSVARPFFVLTEQRVNWDQYNLQDLAAVGVIEVAYTEQALRFAEHKAAKNHFVSWTSSLIQSCAERSSAAGVPIAAIRQSVMPQRTPRAERDPDRPESDYFWCAWDFFIGEVDRYKR